MLRHLLPAVRVTAAAPLVLAALAASAGAQVALSGNVSDVSSGPLLSGVVYHAQNKLKVPAGETLTVQAGAIVKFKTGLDWHINVDGTLDVNGTAADPVIFTSILDDTAGGDTALDGPTAGAPGDWAGLIVGDSPLGTVDAEYLELRYGGYGGWNAVYVSGGIVDLRHCTIRDANNDGVTFLQKDTPFTRIENCAFVNCEDWALDDVPLEVVPGIKNNTATGCGVDAIRLPGSTGTSVSGSATIGPENCLNGALVVDGVVTVQPGATLTLEAGTVIKIDENSSTRWVLDGDVVINGTSSDPVVFTSSADDDYAGDTLGDGPTTGARGDWTGLKVNGTGSLTADYAVFRHAGKAGESQSYMAVTFGGGDVTLRDCVFRDNLRSAIDGRNLVTAATIERCDFVDNEDYAIRDLRWESLPGLRDNTASGNGFDYLRTSNVTVESDATVSEHNQINGVVVWSFMSVSSGARLTLEKGVVLKCDNDNRITVNGALDVLGTPHEPVVFTTIDDDEYAGDTNGDGPSVGTPGTWAGLRIEPAAAASTLRNLRIRYSGDSHPGVWGRSPLTAYRAVRVEKSSRDGFDLDDAASVVNCTAWQNGLEGFKLDSGSFDLVHCTSVGNTQAGIDHGGLYTGVIRNSVSWGNGGGNYDHVSAGDLVASCGDAGLAGIDGNVDADPLFVNEALGELRLTAGSPCVDAADFATALPLVFDAQEHSRLLPGGPGASALPDMGAHELAHWVLFVQGQAATGGSLDIQVLGETGIALLAYGNLDGAAFLDPYGYITAGVATLVQIPGTFPVNSAVALPIPANPALVGVDFGLQAIGLSTVSPGFQHFSNLYRGRFE